ncbi:MAG: acireductone synthase, partial [Hydrocarboniphaga effusa]|nr:acireductone synthase [Hydrocarboniphaga effusa]
FPYARRHLRAFLKSHASEPAVRSQMEEVSRLEGRALPPDEAATVLERWIDEDRKITPMKALQGMVWKVGYQAGELKGHLYPDTAPQLRKWHDAGKKLYVYSSGSIEAQKLIFGHTEAGDLTPLFSGYFDTRIGAKKEPSSYAAILRDIGLGGEAVLFLSDVGEELDAARHAGMKTCQLLRDHKAKPAPNHPQALDFAGVKV